jgi:cobalamin biosynthetic protein CobC
MGGAGMIDRWTWHGGGLAAARATFGDDGAPWLDLSTGINPNPWPVPPLTFDWSRLPDEADLRALEAAAADHFGVAAHHVCAVPGSEIGLRLMGQFVSGPAFHLMPAYRTHAEMLGRSMPLILTELARADGATLILANPNNPDGRVLDRDTMRDLLDRRGSSGRLLLDEAFADASPDISLASEVGRDDRLILFRSFGKYFGLAGVRLGFVLATPPVLARLRETLGAWPLSAAAIAIGTAAYRDREWIDVTRDQLARRAAELDARLQAVGLTATGSCPLFCLLHVADAYALFERLARRHILTRPFADNPSWLRIGLPPDRQALDRLMEALANG